MRYALLLMLCGCAATGRRDLRDGAPVRAPVAEPRTSYTPAGAGLPEYWGQPEAKVERSPYARVLPQTPETRREAGLWSGTPTMASSAPSILGVEIPSAVADDMSITEVAACTQFADAALYDNPQVVVAFHQMNKDDKRCAAFRLFLECTHDAAKANERVAALHRAVGDAVAATCDKRLAGIDDWVGSALVALAKHAMGSIKGPPRARH